MTKSGILSNNSTGQTEIHIYMYTYKQHHSTAENSFAAQTFKQSLEESRWTKSRHMFRIFVVHSTHLYVYARRRNGILD